jgi:hypothetical protein
VPRHVARLVTWLVVDYFTSCRLVIDYFTYAACPVASARRTACRVTHRRLLRLAQARRRLLRLRCASGCLGTSRGSSRGSSRLLRLAQACRRLLHLRRASGCFGTSRGLSCDSSSTTSPRAGSSSTTLPMSRVRVPRHVARLITRLVVDYFASRRLVVDYFASAARPSASACCVTHCRLLRLAQARRRLLRLRCASGCLYTSRGSSRRSSWTTSPTPRVRVPRNIARLVSPLAVDYFTYAARLDASARRAAHHTARRRLLRAPRLRLAATLALVQPRRASRLLVSWQHWLYINYTARRRYVVFWSHRIDHSSRLVFQTSREQ